MKALHNLIIIFQVEAVSKKMDENTTEYETKLQEYAQLLDIRAGRIRVSGSYNF